MFRQILIFFFTAATFASGAEKIDAQRAANTVVLDETGVANLRIETVTVEETDFEESVFSLGRVEIVPSKRTGVSSRTAGRITELKFSLGDEVIAGALVAKLESRQFGDPPAEVKLKATMGGLVTKANVALGEPLEPEATLLEITDLTEVHAVARVPEHEAGKLKAGTIAHIKVAALPDKEFEGTLLRFGTEADRESGTIDAIFVLPNPGMLIRPGMRAEFSIVIGKRENVMSVPRAAIQGDAINRYIYVKDFDLKNTFIKTPVVVGAINAKSAEIVSGLLGAEDVVTRGAYSLAFAGGGTMSLKEKLDADHGHDHNEDGSEMTAAQKAARDSAKGGAHAAETEGGGGMLWKVISAALALMLVVQSVRGRKPKESKKPEAKKPLPESKEGGLSHAE